MPCVFWNLTVDVRTCCMWGKSALWRPYSAACLQQGHTIFNLIPIRPLKSDYMGCLHIKNSPSHLWYWSGEGLPISSKLENPYDGMNFKKILHLPFKWKLNEPFSLFKNNVFFVCKWIVKRKLLKRQRLMGHFSYAVFMVPILLRCSSFVWPSFPILL